MKTYLTNDIYCTFNQESANNKGIFKMHKDMSIESIFVFLFI